MVVHMLPVLCQSWQGDDLFSLFDRPDNHAGSPMGNHDIAPGGDFGKFLPVHKPHIGKMLRKIGTRPNLGCDFLPDNSILHQFIQLLQQAVKLKFLGAKCHKYHQ